MINWHACSHVERVPDRLDGDWVLLGSRIPVTAVLDSAADGLSPEEIVKLYPGATAETVLAVLQFASTHASGTER
jgi:uncharacterized protein (DUF433 family)